MSAALLNTAIAFALLWSPSLYAQGFTYVLSKPDSLREAGHLTAALKEFRIEYERNPRSILNTYNFACAWAVYDKKDSAFRYLREAILIDSSETWLTDPDFTGLQEDPRWEQLQDWYLPLMEKKYGRVVKDKDYAKKLWNMRASDQAYYYDLRILREKLGPASPAAFGLWKLKEIYNRKNQEELEQHIREKGWPRISQVGARAADAAFFVIQHAEDEKQKKYIGVIEQYCREGEADWESYALMYDRIQVNADKPQKYGSQVRRNTETGKYELFPLLDGKMVDQWRKDAGMSPLAEYLKRYDIVWKAGQ